MRVRLGSGRRVSSKESLTLQFLALLVILRNACVSESPGELLKIQSVSPRPDPQNQNAQGWTTGI